MMEDRIGRLQKQLNEIRYELGDAMGDHAPEYFRRRRGWASDALVGLGSVILAVGVGYLAMRLSDKKMHEMVGGLKPHSKDEASEPEKTDERSWTPQGRSERPAETRPS